MQECFSNTRINYIKNLNGNPPLSNSNNMVYYMTLIIQLLQSAVLEPDQILVWLCFLHTAGFTHDQYQDY